MERVAAYDLIVIASILWVGYVGSKIFQRAKLPAVSGFLLVGILLGPQVLNVLNPSILHRLSFFEPLALGVITFIIGEQLDFRRLAKHGARSLLLPLIEITLSAVLAYFVVFLVTGQRALALFLGVLAITTAPATAIAVVTETKSKGKLTELLSKTVALNNIVSVALFTWILPFALWASAGTVSLSVALTSASKNILLSISIGLAAALAFTLLVPRLQSAGELFVFTLGHLTLAVAISILVGASPILATLIAGVFTANLSANESQSLRIFGSLKVIAEPIYLIFFVLSGASLRFDVLLALGFALFAYVLARSTGKIGGSFVGGLASGLSLKEAKNFSMSLLSQSAIAIGLSLIVLDKYPALGQEVNAIILGAVIIFELVGPYLLKRSLEKSGETGQDDRRVDMQLEGGGKEPVKVLVPLGRKSLSLRNTKTIGRLIRKVQGEVVALHVSAARSEKSWKASASPSTDAVELFAELLRKEDIDCRVRMERSSKIAETICEVARQENVDLVIMDASWQSKFLSRFFVDVTGRVATSLDCPVLVLPE